MLVEELVVNAQLKLANGATIVIQTPMLAPISDTTVDDIQNALMALGEDAIKKKQKEMMNKENIIEPAHILGMFGGNR